MKRNLLGLFVGLFLFITLTSESGCNSNSDQESSVTDVKAVSTSFSIPKNSRGNTTEQQQILDRIVVTSDPTKILWIHIYALDGHIIFRNPVRCKVTSSGKRLEPTHAAVESQSRGVLPTVRGEGLSNIRTDELMQPDGTFGTSDPYIFWFDPLGRYHQKGEGYLLTDYPIDLDNPVDKITGLYNAQSAALEWQHKQEEILKKQELSTQKK